MTIGVFDSGLGGLTVAKEIMRVLPWQKIIYFGDTARAPYGNKSPQEVAKYALENTRFLLKKKAKMIVIGCNTASAVAGQMLRKKFPDVPVLEVITPAVREALRVTRTGRIGVIGTRTTIQSGAYQQWFVEQQFYSSSLASEVFWQEFCAGKFWRACPPKSASGGFWRACPLFVPLVEGGQIEGVAAHEVAHHYLKPLKEARVDTLILGCTHYPFLKSAISRIMGDGVQLVDSAQTVARELAEMQNAEWRMKNAKKRVPKHEFYVSQITSRFNKLAEKWLDAPIILKLAKI